MEILYLCCQVSHGSYLANSKKIQLVPSLSLLLQELDPRAPRDVPAGVCSRVPPTHTDLICFGWLEPREMKSRVYI